MHRLAQLDHAHVWHPFTQMRDWLREEPIVLARGRGTELVDVHGRRYLDANSSIWTNLHGHNHPRLNQALRRQLGKVAHTSALGFANEPASLLAGRLVNAARRGLAPSARAGAGPELTKVFFSDDGSTALEVALKLAYEFTRRTRGPRPSPRFLTLQGAYHGDTIGAVSLGHIDLFHRAWAGLLFRSDAAMAPYCYRCPFNRAKPERADAREYRRCNWECAAKVGEAFARAKRRGNPYAGFVFEPLVQGAAGMIPQPAGWLGRVATLAREHGALLIADEVMTAFGRTGGPTARPSLSSPDLVEEELDDRGRSIPPHPSLSPRHSSKFAGTAPGEGGPAHAGPGEGSFAFQAKPGVPSLFASHQEGVQPDLLCLAKGLTGGYLPMAATLASDRIFEAFLGDYAEFKTFFHGHSYTANPLGAAVSLASMDLLEAPAGLRARRALERSLRAELGPLWALPAVGDIRQVGLVAGIELVRDWRTREPFALPERVGIRVCHAMARRGVLTRPIGNVVVIMPPYSTTPRQLRRMVHALAEAVTEVTRPAVASPTGIAGSGRSSMSGRR